MNSAKLLILFLAVLSAFLVVQYGSFFQEEETSQSFQEQHVLREREVRLELPAGAPEASEEPPQEKERAEEDFERIDPPEAVRAIYLTAWSAATPSRLNHAIELVRTTELNAVVIDVKDFSGFVLYQTDVEEVKTYGAEAYVIRDMEGVLERLREEGIYTIARITVFQDPALARARPDLAVHSSEKISSVHGDKVRAWQISDSLDGDTLWTDRKGLHWTDPAAPHIWEYHARIARDAFGRGFDEINFDYIRFPSDGKLSDMEFPVWKREGERREVLRAFFEYLSEELEGIRISADVFGLVATNRDDLGIGQVLEDTFGVFDVVSPMVYPSHYREGSFGFQEPVRRPYEVVFRALSSAQARLNVFREKERPEARDTRVRPWLQDFSIRGVEYGSEEVAAQIRASQDALGEEYRGYMLWDPRNIYTREAFDIIESP